MPESNQPRTDVPVERMLNFMAEKGITARLINDYPADSVAQEAIEFTEGDDVIACVEFTAEGVRRAASMEEFERRQALPFVTGRLVVPIRRLVQVSYETDKSHPGLASRRFDRIFGRNETEGTTE